MSETVKQFPSQSRLTAVKAREERPTILPFPQGSVSGQPGSIFNTASQNGHETAIPLVKELCEALNSEAISYCHWKSNWRLGNWLSGDGDLDLLVASADAQRFANVVFGLGFVQAESSQKVETPGVLHFYGWDKEAEKFVHLHVYYRLLVGHDLTTNYHLPIEELLLQSANSAGLIPTPQPEFELVVFVLRKVLGSSTVDAMLRRMMGRSDGFEKTAQELDYLEANTDRAKVYDLMNEIVPGLKASFFERCLESLRLESYVWNRTIVRLQLEKALSANARRHPRLDGVLKSWRLISKLFRERVLRRSARKHFVNGGVLIALVGGDGAGKTTAVNAVNKWLGDNFAVRTFHFGKPRRSPFTIAVILALRGRTLIKPWLKKIFPARWDENTSSHPGYLHQVRWVCAARDRHRVYLKARRFANSGGIAICDRYVVPGIALMDGPNIERTLEETELTWLSRALLNAENRHYRQIMQPDLLLVLLVDPEIAVRRKTNEQERHVRKRSQEIWQTDWSGTRAHLVDAGQSPAGVLTELRAQIWQQI
jgi:thymidylate kinase